MLTRVLTWGRPFLCWWHQLAHTIEWSNNADYLLMINTVVKWVNELPHVPTSWCRNESVVRSSYRPVGSQFRARRAATGKALSPIGRRVRGTTRLTTWQSMKHAMWIGLVFWRPRCQQVWDVGLLWCVIQQRLANQQAQLNELIFDPLANW